MLVQPETLRGRRVDCDCDGVIVVIVVVVSVGVEVGARNGLSRSRHPMQQSCREKKKKKKEEEKKEKRKKRKKEKREQYGGDSEETEERDRRESSKFDLSRALLPPIALSLLFPLQLFRSNCTIWKMDLIMPLQIISPSDKAWIPALGLDTKMQRQTRQDWNGDCHLIFPVNRKYPWIW